MTAQRPRFAFEAGAAERHQHKLAWISWLQDLPAERQQRELSLLATQDPQLASEVEGLLDDAPTLVQTPDAPRLCPLIGSEIGNYRIVRLIGEGGMGAVFLAERQDEISMQVALKLIRGATPRLLQRFQRERQILASLQHPGIARLYDGGTTEDGTPYFVMEYVDGAPIHRYLGQQSLSLSQRLQLFIAICDAVAYAHRNLVIHRDIKPGNVLVGRDGKPRLVDFGIAALLDDEGGSQQTLFAATPAYASPEQLCGERLTAASDEYSLGLLLQELITGQPVFDGRHRQAFTAPTPLDEHFRIPSELRWILQRSLAQEPERRYGNVSELAADLRRFLDGQAVLARPPSRAYLLRKFVTRHRLAVCVVAGLSAALLATTALTIHAWMQQRQAWNEARIAAEQQSAINGFLVSILQSPDPRVGSHDIRVVDLIDKALADVSTRFAGQPQIQSELLLTLGRSLAGLGQTQRSIEILQQAHTQMLAYRDADSHDVMSVENEILESRFPMQASPAVAEEFGRLMRRCSARFGATDALCLTASNNYGTAFAMLVQDGQTDYASKAKRLLAANLALRSRALGEESAEVTHTRNNYASLLMTIGEPAKAAELYRRNIEIQRRVFGADNYYTLTSETNLAACLDDLGHGAEALSMMQSLIPRIATVMGSDHPTVLYNRTALGRLLHEAHQDQAARQELEAVIQLAGDRPETTRIVTEAKRLLGLIDHADAAPTKDSST